jgi:hypothetical protein
MAALTYPVRRYEPSPVIDVASKAERERLSPSALKAFFNIVDRWGVRDSQTIELPVRLLHLRAPFLRATQAPNLEAR